MQSQRFKEYHQIVSNMDAHVNELSQSNLVEAITIIVKFKKNLNSFSKIKNHESCPEISPGDDSEYVFAKIFYIVLLKINDDLKKASGIPVMLRPFTGEFIRGNNVRTDIMKRRISEEEGRRSASNASISPT